MLLKGVSWRRKSLGYHISFFSSYMIVVVVVVVVVVASESWVAFELLSISIDVGVVVELTSSSESLVLSRDTSNGSILFQI